MDPFRTRDHVPRFDEIVRDYAVRSATTRARQRSVLDIPYGKAPRERLDLFLPREPGPDAPVHVFVHGGYWRMFAKEDFSFVAETVVEAGAIAVVIGYDLMPHARMDRIVDEVRRAARWVATEIWRFGGDATALSVSGHSAGAHLCCWLLDPDAAGMRVASALLLSGVYDLAPLRTSFLHDLIGLTDEEVERWSPLRRRLRADASVSLLVGEHETAPFHEQAAQLAKHLGTGGAATRRLVLPGEDHMTAVRALGDARSIAGRELRRVIDASRVLRTV
ncbi:alpha/beta hydrolase [Aureimonas sp. AU4]|uniref:alpha/beta hydrolase n=1 Tax=Aureimonas sp. AU4 TaxID=1638163 RepID=UPI0007856251|nr:alpha/beta hydrolase [Aureimonas sp. AU4]